MLNCVHCGIRYTANDPPICDHCLGTSSPNDRYDWDLDDLLDDYSTNVLNEYRIRLNPKKRYFGIELEYQVRCNNLGNFHKHIYTTQKALPEKYAILKQDGSIFTRYNVGYEIVTVPKENIEDHFNALKPIFDFDFLITRPYTGMHVHVSRAGITSLALGKLLVFLNNPKNRPLMRKIAGRNANDYFSYKDKSLLDGKSTRYYDRYEVLNLRNDNTIEFRLFKVPSTFEEFKARLQFTKASIEFCEQSSYRFIDVENFKVFVKKSNYRELKHVLNYS